MNEKDRANFSVSPTFPITPVTVWQSYNLPFQSARLRWIEAMLGRGQRLIAVNRGRLIVRCRFSRWYLLVRIQEHLAGWLRSMASSGYWNGIIGLQNFKHIRLFVDRRLFNYSSLIVNWSSLYYRCVSLQSCQALSSWPLFYRVLLNLIISFVPRNFFSVTDFLSFLFHHLRLF